MSPIEYKRVWIISFLLVMLFIPLGIISAQAPQNLPASNQAPQNAPTPYPGEDGAAYDARVYAAQYGVSAQEAKRRFALQDAAGDLNAQLLAKESTTFAGLWLEHTPQFKVVVQFAGAAGPNIAAYTRNKELAALVEARAAKIALRDLEKAQTQAISSLANSGARFESGLNVQKNRVELYVLAQDRPKLAAKMTAAQMPAYVDLVTVPALSRPMANEWYGGQALYDPVRGYCTTAFSVRRNADGARGVSTAGHCENKLYDAFTHHWFPLAFKGEKFGGPYEVQWHTLPGYAPVNKIQWDVNGATRYITGMKARDYQAIGAYVCKYGIVTYYGCGTIADKNYRPVYDSRYPQPKIPFTATFIRVLSTTNPFLEQGDSGGPWYNGYTAYGITNSAFGFNGVYMAIDYIISGLDLRVLNTPYGPTQAAPRP